MEKRRLGKDKVTWETFKKEFLGKYFSRVACEHHEQAFNFLKQGERTVTQYETEFHRLSRFAPDLISTEEARIKRFYHGLKPTIQNDLAILDFA